MKNIKERIDFLYKSYGKISWTEMEDEFESIKDQYCALEKDASISNDIKIEGAYYITKFVLDLVPEFGLMEAYELLKKALELDENSLLIRFGLVHVFKECPSPPNTIITREEFFEHVVFLLNRLDLLDEKEMKPNFISALIGYFNDQLFRLKNFPERYKE